MGQGRPMVVERSWMADLAVGGGAGLVSGSLGVGGGLVLTPYLVIVRKVPQKVAQATALVLVTMAASAGVIPYAIGGSVAWVPAAFILAGGLGGAYLGTIIVARVSNAGLQAAFGVLLVVVALRLVWPQGQEGEAGQQIPSLTVATAVVYVGAGLAMGLLSAIFGIGGGIVLVPVLVAVVHFGQREAAGTSLAVMIIIALLGALRLTRLGYTDWRAGSRFGVAAAICAFAGAYLALLLPETILRAAFAVLLAFVGVRLIARSVRDSRSRASFGQGNA